MGNVRLRYGWMAAMAVAGAWTVAQVPAVYGQQAGSAPEVPTGTVTGLVLASDTQRPVRFAQLQLQRATPDGDGQGGQRPGNAGGGSINIRTDVDGTFTANGVAIGNYYVLAMAPGYVAEGLLLRAKAAAGSDPAALLAALPQVQVTAGSLSRVTVPIQRGGVITGHVEWEDGTAACGVSINTGFGTSGAVAQTPAALQQIPILAGAGEQSQTDDRGNFRISGLATAEYVVFATVQSFTQTGGGPQQVYASPIRVFAPGVFRKANARTVSVRAGDERTDVRIVIDLRGLRAVSGHANSTNPNETVARGRVQLIDSGGDALSLYGQIDAEGSFKVRYVPPGTYTLRISGANSQALIQFRGGRGGQDNGGTQPKGVAYQDFATTITVGDTDVTGVAVSLVPVASH